MENRTSSPTASAPLLGSPLRYPVLPPGYSDAEQNMTGYQSGLPAGHYGNPESSADYSQPQIGVIGSCPACKVGVLDDHFTCCGILCAIFLFPLGLICCLATRQRRCSNCGAVFG